MGVDPLYRRILGSDFDRLPPVLKDFHSGPRQAEGEFVLSVPQGALRSVARAVYQLPQEPTAGHGLLDTEWKPPDEKWTRDIGDWRFVTTQWEDGGLLFERNRRLTLAFRVLATADGMIFHQVRARWMKLPLPRVLSPRVTADVRATDDGWTVAVAIFAPCVGEVLRYEGSLKAL